MPPWSPRLTVLPARVARSKNRPLVFAITILSSLSTAYELGYFIWIMAHPETGPFSAIYPWAHRAWLLNLPFFFFGFLWLVMRISYTCTAPYMAFRAAHPILDKFSAPAVILAAFAFVWSAISLCSQI